MLTSRRIEIVIWGRGGQGAKTAGDLLTLALYRAGMNPQGQPRYSADRMGAPVTYAIRYNGDRSRVADPSWIRNPQIVILFDLTLLEEYDLTKSWPTGMMVVANARPAAAQLDRLHRFRVALLDGAQIARECGLMKGSVPALSTVMPGAFAAASGLLTLESLEAVTPEMRGPISRYPEPNIRALRAGYSQVAFLAPGKEASHVAPAWMSNVHGSDSA
ncbi:MAG TPA: 2-oxoacid:acceptor oxidoreductase family protein [Armatimonadota bacterium]|nr:2-oxoacid:acceptor oxidoreductase family protein [Armatimonadota bacterium]